MKKPYDRYSRRRTPPPMRAVPPPEPTRDVEPSKKPTLKPCPICEQGMVSADQVEAFARRQRGELPTDPPPPPEVA